MDILYAMPGQEHRVFVNVVHACPNACLFCVDFLDGEFYGFELRQKGRRITPDQIIDAVRRYPGSAELKEIYFCGIGEPLLCYDTVVESTKRLRTELGNDVMLAVNTSGTFYRWNERVDFASHFDLIQVSLNAESSEKYDLICRPKFSGAFQSVMKFLSHLRGFIDETGIASRVELSVVDTAEIEYLPERARVLDSVPQPDINACKAIAASFRWPLKVKSLMRDCGRPKWARFADGIRTRMRPS